MHAVWRCSGEELGQAAQSMCQSHARSLGQASPTPHALDMVCSRSHGSTWLLLHMLHESFTHHSIICSMGRRPMLRQTVTCQALNVTSLVPRGTLLSYNFMDGNCMRLLPRPASTWPVQCCLSGPPADSQTCCTQREMVQQGTVVVGFQPGIDYVSLFLTSASPNRSPQRSPPGSFKAALPDQRFAGACACMDTCTLRVRRPWYVMLPV